MIAPPQLNQKISQFGGQMEFLDVLPISRVHFLINPCYKSGKQDISHFTPKLGNFLISWLVGWGWGNASSTFDHVQGRCFQLMFVRLCQNYLSWSLCAKLFQFHCWDLKGSSNVHVLVCGLWTANAHLCTISLCAELLRVPINPPLEIGASNGLGDRSCYQAGKLDTKRSPSGQLRQRPTEKRSPSPCRNCGSVWPGFQSAKATVRHLLALHQILLNFFGVSWKLETTDEHGFRSCGVRGHKTGGSLLRLVSDWNISPHSNSPTQCVNRRNQTTKWDEVQEFIALFLCGHSSSGWQISSNERSAEHAAENKHLPHQSVLLCPTAITKLLSDSGGNTLAQKACCAEKWSKNCADQPVGRLPAFTWLKFQRWVRDLLGGGSKLTHVKIHKPFTIQEANDINSRPKWTSVLVPHPEWKWPNRSRQVSMNGMMPFCNDSFKTNEGFDWSKISRVFWPRPAETKLPLCSSSGLLIEHIFSWEAALMIHSAARSSLSRHHCVWK